MRDEIIGMNKEVLNSNCGRIVPKYFMCNLKFTTICFYSYCSYIPYSFYNNK